MLATVACIVLGATGLPLKFNVFMAYNTLLHTGDRSYYDEDKSRGWREDGRRAWETYGFGVFHLPPPPQAGKSLADALRAYKAEAGNAGAAYLAPESDYWPLVSDCDGKVHGDLPAGMGVTPIKDYLGAIRDTGYDGTVSIELEYSPDPDKIVEWAQQAYDGTAAIMRELGVRS